MIKKAALIIISMAMFIACCGCQLAVESGGSEINADALCGMFITFDYLDIGDSFVDNIDWNAAANGDQPFYDMEAQKVYAVPKDEKAHKEYYFEGIEGLRMFGIFVPGNGESEGYNTTCTDDLLMDPEVAYSHTDAGTEITLEATLLVCPKLYAGGGMLNCYCNPVYQTPEGEVYMMPGSGLSAELVTGSSMSQTLSGSTTKTVNGEKNGRTATVKLTVTAIDEIKKYVLKEFDDEDQVISSLEIVKDNIPKEVALHGNTAYAILEKHCVSSEGKSYVERSFTDISQDYMGVRFINGDGLAEAFVITLKNLPAKQ